MYAMWTIFTLGPGMRETADAALKDTEPKVQQELAGIARGPVTRKVYEVWRVVEAD